MISFVTMPQANTFYGYVCKKNHYVILGSLDNTQVSFYLTAKNMVQNVMTQSSQSEITFSLK